jgi:hypothetical protein
MKFISIMGYARSGTTFLGTYASHCGEKVFFAGEIDKGIEKYLSGRTSYCSCGKIYEECPVWSKVLPCISRQNVDLKKITDKIQEVTGAAVIIDSSKSLQYIKKFKEIFKSDFYTIHLKRNPKGVILSRMNNRRRRVDTGHHPKPQLARRFNLMLIYDSLEWTFHNYWMEKFKTDNNNLNLTYDSFEKELPDKIKEFYIKMDIPLTDGNNSLDTHVVYGANGRLSYKKNVRVNKSWQKDLNSFQKGLVDLTTMPLRLLNGYDFK